MITPAKAWTDSQGKAHTSLESAQVAELEIILNSVSLIDSMAPTEQLALVIVKQKEKVIDILTTSESSRPKARKVNGGTKPRKPRATTQTALA